VRHALASAGQCRRGITAMVSHRPGKPRRHLQCAGRSRSLCKDIQNIRVSEKYNEKKIANREKFKNFKRRTKIITHKLLFAQYFT